MPSIVYQGPSDVGLPTGKRIFVRQTGSRVLGKVATGHFGHRLSLMGTSVCHI